MDHGYFNMGSAGFWIFLAVIIAMGNWEKTRRNAEKHETLRRIIEKTGSIDEAKMKELFAAAPTNANDWLKSNPGDGYRGLRIAGTIFMFLAAGVATCFLVLQQTAVIPPNGAIIGFAISSAIAVFGGGLFFCSRFTDPPPRRGNEPPVR